MKGHMLFVALAALMMGCAEETTPPETQSISSNVAEASDGTELSLTFADQKTMDGTLSGFVKDGKVAGVSALVFKDGEEIYFGAFGYADREAQEPMSRDTLVQIFSMTKPVAGVTLMTQYERGLFELDDPIADYIPELANLKVFEGMDEDGNPILVDPHRQPTVLDFMRHTAGLGDAGTEGYVGERWREVNPTDLSNTLSEFAEKLGTIPLLYHPGERWRYSSAVDVQALLAERLAEKPFRELVQEKVLTPLGMDDTGYFVPEEKRDRLAAAYRRDEETGVLERVPDEGAYAPYTQVWPFTPGSWGLVSSIDDYMTFAQMLAHGGQLDGRRILKPETIDLMSTNYLSDNVTERLWLPSKGQVGFGIDFAVRLREPVDDAENFGAVGEFFWDGAASTLFWVDPENDLTAVFFVQLFPFDGLGLHKDFRDAVYGVTQRGTPAQSGE